MNDNVIPIEASSLAKLSPAELREQLVAQNAAIETLRRLIRTGVTRAAADEQLRDYVKHMRHGGRAAPPRGRYSASERIAGATQVKLWKGRKLRGSNPPPPSDAKPPPPPNPPKGSSIEPTILRSAVAEWIKSVGHEETLREWASLTCARLDELGFSKTFVFVVSVDSDTRIEVTSMYGSDKHFLRTGDTLELSIDMHHTTRIVPPTE